MTNTPMLVLSRRPDQSVVIADDIVVTVLGVEKNGTVRLGIEAPRQYRVLRKELVEEVGEVNLASLAGGDVADLPWFSTDLSESETADEA